MSDPAVPSVPASAAARWRGVLGRWSGILGAYAAAQLLIQGALMGAGLLVVRVLPLREFALYALATSFLTTLAFVSDFGASSALAYFYRQARSASVPFAPYVTAARTLRTWLFAAGAVAVAIPFELGARANGYAPGESLPSLVAILAAAWLGITGTLGVVVRRLEGELNRAYRAEAVGAVGKLLALCLVVAMGWLDARAALGAVVAGSAAMALSARPGGGNASREEARRCRREMARYLLPLVPGGLYFTLQGPLSIWLAAWFGGTRNIAEVGALSRLSLLMGLFTPLAAAVLVPHLARITDEALYRRRYVQFLVLLALPVGALMALALGLPRLFLAIVGPAYESLHVELALAMASGGATVLLAYVTAVNLARSWSRLNGPVVALLVAIQAALLAALPLDTTRGVLTMGLLMTLSQLAIQGGIAAAGFRRPGLVHWA